MRLKRLISLLCAAMAICVNSRAQDALDVLVASAASGRLDFNYSFSSGLDTKMTGRGHAVVQGDCFYINGNGLEIFCDGSTASTVDRESKEVIIETIDGEDSGNYINPALLISSIDTKFKRKSSANFNYCGKNAVRYILSPKRLSGLSHLTLVVSPDGKRLYSASVATDDAGNTDFVVSDFRILPSGAVSDFRLDTSTLDKSYIVTDLR